MLALLASATLFSLSPAGAAEQARQATIAACGIDERRLAVEPWADSALASLKVLGTAALPDEALRCYGRTVAAMISVAPEFESGKLNERYAALVERDNLANARRMLAGAGLLGRLPAYRPERDALGKFARRLESLCGAAPRSVLGVDASVIMLRKDAFEGPVAFPRVNCVINAGIAVGHDPLRPPPVNVVIPAPTSFTPVSLTH